MSDWIDDIYDRFVNGENPGELYLDLKDRLTEERARQRMTPIRPESMRLLRAFEGDGIVSDYETLEAIGALNREGNLTSDATRNLLDTWDTMDRQSS